MDIWADCVVVSGVLVDEVVVSGVLVVEVVVSGELVVEVVDVGAIPSNAWQINPTFTKLHPKSLIPICVEPLEMVKQFSEPPKLSG